MKLWGTARVLVGVGLPLAMAGCALTSKSDPVLLRYFTPEAPDARVNPPETAAPAARTTKIDLRLGRINSASYLKDRIAYRGPDFEVGYYEDYRWTEKPEAYLRRALARAFFEEQGLHQVISGPGPTLEVDLNAFEEIKTPKHIVRVQMTWLLRDDESVKRQETITVDRPIAGSDPTPPGTIVAAISGALDETVKRLVERIVATLVRNDP